MSETVLPHRALSPTSVRAMVSGEPSIYWKRVKRYWVVLVTGTLLAVYFLITGLVRFNPPAWVSVGIFFMALSYAQYQVWHEMLRECRRLTLVLAERERRQRNRDSLGLCLIQGSGFIAGATLAGWFTASGGNLFVGSDATTAKRVEATSIPETGTLESDVSDWITSVGTRIESTYGVAEAAQFLNDIGIPELGTPLFEAEHAKREAQIVAGVQKRVYRLQEILNQQK